VLRETAVGFRVRVAGASPTAAASAGRVRLGSVYASTFLVSGAIAGLAGAAQVGGVTFALYEGLSPGYGYEAIAVALLARLHPIAIVAAAVGFGALDAGADAMQRDAGIPAQFVAIVEAVVVLAALAIGRASALTVRSAESLA
jgi:simple sugar transport system permease protein